MRFVLPKFVALQALGALLAILTTLGGQAAFAKTPKSAVIVPSFDLEHKDLTEVLQSAVVVNGSTSLVNYKWLNKGKNQMALVRYIKNMAAVSQKTYDSWPDNDKMAFLINAYNVSTLKLILDNYPVKSIQKIGKMFSNPMKMDFIILLGKHMTLEKIEQTLSQSFHEPRVHFALNSSAVSAPALRNEAYVGSRLESQLDEQARLFLRDGVRNQFDVIDKTLKLSNIFETYKNDFLHREKEGEMTIGKFIAPYITDDEAVRNELSAGTYSVTYTEYDWNLNETKD